LLHLLEAVLVFMIQPHQLLQLPAAHPHGSCQQQATISQQQLMQSCQNKAKAVAKQH
jgi:hypothetical protein